MSEGTSKSPSISASLRLSGCITALRGSTTQLIETEQVSPAEVPSFPDKHSRAQPPHGLEPSTCGLQNRCCKRATFDYLENRITAERVVVVAVLVSGQDAVDPLVDHFVRVVVGQVWVARVVETGDETIRGSGSGRRTGGWVEFPCRC